jgi:hypothetical protein
MGSTPTNPQVIPFLQPKTQQRLFACAKKLGVSADALLNTLINDEFERQRLLKVFHTIANEPKKISVPSQKITMVCKKHLSPLHHESESVEIKDAIGNLYHKLLQEKLLCVNARAGELVESKRINTSRVGYYWYEGSLMKYIGMWFGTMDVYLFHSILNPIHEILFIGMPTNVEVCVQVFIHLQQLFKKVKRVYKKNNPNFGTKSETEYDVGRYMYHFVEQVQDAEAYIENDDCNKVLYDYVQEKFAYTLQ